MGNLSVEIGANTSKLVSEISKAKSSLEAFVGEMNDAADAGEKLTDVSDEQVQSFQKVLNQLENLTEGSMATKKEQKELGNSIKELKEQWAALSNEARSSDFGKMMSETIRAAKEELDGLKGNLSNVDNIKMSGSLKKQLRENTNELVKLTAQYRAMSDAERASASGQELARKMSEIRAKAGELKDTIGDVSEEIKVMASDTPNLDVFNAALGIGADAMSTYSSVVAKFTGDENALKNAISTVMAVQSAANLVTKVTNALQSSSVIMLKTRAVQEGAATVAINLRTAAEGRGVIATTAATAAQKAFNVVAKANPYVLIATAAIAAVSAITYFTKSTDEAAEAQKELDDAFKNQTQQLGENIAQVNSLSLEWNNLKTNAEKKQWIEDNKEEFRHLGIEIENVDDAENAFNNNTGAIIQALELRAKAAAYAAVAADKYKKAIEGREDAENADFSWYEELYTGLTTQLKQWASGEHVQTFNQIMHKARGDMYREAESEAEKALEYLKKSQELKNEASKTLLSADVKETHKDIKEPKKDKTKTSTTKQDVVVEGSLTDIENKLSDLKKKYKDGVIKIAPDDYKKKVADLELQIVQKKLEMGIDVQFMPGSVAAMEDELSKLKSSYSKGFRPDLNKKEFKKQVKELEKAIKEKKIEMGIDPEIPEGSIKELDEKINEKKHEFELAIDDKSRRNIKKEIDELTKKKADIELKITPVVDEERLINTSRDINRELNDLMADMAEDNKFAKWPPDPKSNLGKYEKLAREIQEEIEPFEKIYDFYKRNYRALRNERDAINDRIAAGEELQASDIKMLNLINALESGYNTYSKQLAEASKNMYDLNSKQAINRGSQRLIKEEISFIGDLSAAAQNCGCAWKRMGEEWNKMTAFEKTTAVIDNTINSIESLISMYEKIMDTIKLFGEISELAAAKKVAANTAEMASDETKMAVETANTQTKIANDTAENTSEIGKLGVKEAGAIAGATSSGASLPFPANIAAIAAGIAAVVAAFAMVFSCFAEGGIVSGGSYIGDKQLVRVNSGEMILNGSQQKRLFDLLNGTGTLNAPQSTSGEVKFVIKGNDLEGVLKNITKKHSRI